MSDLRDAPPPVSSLLDFGGRVVLVTGAARGLGRALALRFAEAGAQVVLGVRRRGAEADALAARLGARAALAEGDLGTEAGARAVVDAAVAAFGRLDAVINNAGSYPVTPLLELDERAWRQVLDDNLSSVAFVTRAAAARFVAQGGGGAIVNVASIEGLAPASGHAHYSAAKAAVLMHTRSAALELGPHRIRVNAVSPGLIWSESLEGAWPDGVARWRHKAPLGSLVEPHQVADACLFLASPAAAAISGANLVVDAGVAATPLF